MRIVVAGAAGFIGFHLCRRLLDQGHTVVGIDNYTTGQRANADELRASPQFSLVEQDIADPLTLAGPVECIYNMACPASPVDFRDKALEIMRTCSQGTKNLLELARVKESIFLQASTSECYGDPQEHPQKETYWGHVNPLGPRAPYDEGKRFAEAMTMAYHRQYKMKTRLVRIFNTYGPRMRADDGRALPNFINQALTNQPLTVHGDGKQTRSFCYVSDLVEAIIRTAASDFVEPINIGSDEEITVLDAAREVVRLAASQSEIRMVPRPTDDPERRQPDLTRAKTVLDWKSVVPRDKGFSETVTYFRGLMK